MLTNYWPISPDVIIRKILIGHTGGQFHCAFFYITRCRALCSEVCILGDAALIHVNLTAHQHGGHGISPCVWRACKGSIGCQLATRMTASYSSLLVGTRWNICRREGESPIRLPAYLQKHCCCPSLRVWSKSLPSSRRAASQGLWAPPARVWDQSTLS
jgi:hypothetical protein